MGARPGRSEVAPAEPPEIQIARCRSLMQLHGAPDHLNLWRAIDWYAARKNREVMALEARVAFLTGLVKRQ